MTGNATKSKGGSYQISLVTESTTFPFQEGQYIELEK